MVTAAAHPVNKANPISLERVEGPWAQAAACSAIGSRPTNEDFHVLRCKGVDPQPESKASVPEATSGGLFDFLPEVVAGPSLPAAENVSVDCLFAVLDGHGGIEPAQLCSQRLPTEVREQLEASGRDTPEARQGACKETCLALDRHLRFKLGPGGAKWGGSTCIFCYAYHDESSSPGQIRLLLANLGDSRAILLRPCGEAEQPRHEIVMETSDHSPDAPKEKDRIVKAGGTVCFAPGSRYEIPRVDGLLGCSRALGDFRYKEDPALLPEHQKVSIEPDVYEHSCESCVLIMGCDGVFDVLTSTEVATIVSNSLVENENDVGDAAFAVVQAAVNHPKQQDNVTCVVALIGSC